MKGINYTTEYMEKLLEYLDQLLYTAFLLKKEKDFENLPMRGLVITEGEVEKAFAQLYKSAQLPEEVLKLLAQQEKELHEIEKKAGDTLPFLRLCQAFFLTELERLALLLAVAPCLNRKYERIYGYLQDQVDVQEPTRGLCVSLAELLTEMDENKTAAFLTGSGNLHFLLENLRTEQKGLAAVCHLRTAVLDFLYGSPELPERLKNRCQAFTPSQRLAPMEIRQEYLEKLNSLMDYFLAEMQNTDEQERGAKPSGMILLYGREGIGKRFLLKHLAAEQGMSLLFLDISELMYEKEDSWQPVLEDLFVESVLMQAQIVLTGVKPEWDTEEETQQRQDCRKEILSWMAEHVSLFFLLSEEKEEQTGDFPGRTVSMELPALTAGEKVRLWKAWGREYPLQQDVNPEQNGNKYILTPRGIRDVLDTAQLLSGMEGQRSVCQENIRQAVKQNQQSQLGNYATLINSRFVWDDLILDEEQKKQMRMVCDQMRYREIVGEQWGFHRKTPYGRGLSVLFYGPPGTGKTMAAQVMANELGLDLYRIDISQMVSKYIGETQKNISRLFEKAKDINAVLFFDEADSLFAKRSEAKDSHDRNANAETAHLLQKLEDYEGITVLATNYLNNIDDAFKRRMKFIIHIAFPESEVRLRLWRSTLPAEARCEEELDFEFFAEHFELSGSSIKEILTNAAYLAASQKRGMMNCDLIEAVKLNYAKYGKILTKDDFGYLSV